MTEISGAVPIRIAAREGPASRTARMKRICETPGTRAPTTTKGHRSERPTPPTSSGSASTTPVRQPIPVMTSAPASGSARRVRPARTVRVKTPKSAPASTAKSTAGTVLGSHRGTPERAHRADPLRDAACRGPNRGRRRLTSIRRAVIGGCALGFATGWNIANTGSVAGQLAGAYGVGLAAIGLFTTALFITHAGMQIPAGRAADRFGARRTGMVALLVILTFNVAALAAPDLALALTARLLIGVGTGLGFIAGSAYVRSKSGSAFAQGIYGGAALGGGGLALAIVPAVAAWIGWRAPFATAVILALGGLALLASGPADGRRREQQREKHVPSGVLRDVRLYKLAVLFSFSLGLSVVLGNWVPTLLQREGGLSRGAAGVIAALTLVLGVASRPVGGWILHTRPGRIRVAVGASLVAGAIGSLAVASATPPALTVLGAMLIGVAAGIPFAPTFQGAARLRPDAQAAAVGFVNGAASLVILVGTPLLGLTFSLPGGGRTGFVVIALLWAGALLLLPSGDALGSELRREPESPSG